MSGQAVAPEQTAPVTDPQEMYAIGLAFGQGQGTAQDFSAALHWFRLAAEAGNVGAQNEVGLYLRSGLGTDPDPAEAARWLAMAADSGNPAYVFDFAEMLEAGLGVPKDEAKAARLYTAAAAAGHADAAVNLGVLYQEGRGVAKDPVRAASLYRGPAEAGHPKAQNNLGLLYTRGEGVKQDYTEAIRWFGLAAQTGMPSAIKNLGRMYENGFGVQINESRAAELYRLAAQTPIDAMLQTRLVADASLMVPDATGEAFQTLQTGAAAGDPLAQLLLGLMLVSAPEAEHQAAAALFRAAAEKGISTAMANLGLLYVKGQGVPQDYVLGYVWLSLAAASVGGEAALLRDQVATIMTPAQLRQAQALSARWQEQRVR